MNACVWAGAVLFMTLSDQLTRHKLGYLYFPNWTAVVILAVVTLLVAISCIEYSVLISARVSDVRAAQQLATLAALPYAAIYVMTEIGQSDAAGVRQLRSARLPLRHPVADVAVVVSGSPQVGERRRRGALLRGKG